MIGGGFNILLKSSAIYERIEQHMINMDNFQYSVEILSGLTSQGQGMIYLVVHVYKYKFQCSIEILFDKYITIPGPYARLFQFQYSVEIFCFVCLFVF